MSLRATPSQTIGPFYRVGLLPLYWSELGSPGAKTTPIHGRVFDGDGPLSDVLLELWLADEHGCYPDPDAPSDAGAGFRGFGRVQADGDGRFEFSTALPGRVPGSAGVLQAPHVSVQIFSRGLMRPLCTRMYFPDAVANETDLVLALVPPSRRATLIATPDQLGRLQWNIHLQGERETVFFEY